MRDNFSRFMVRFILSNNVFTALCSHMGRVQMEICGMLAFYLTLNEAEGRYRMSVCK